MAPNEYSCESLTTADETDNANPILDEDGAHQRRAKKVTRFMQDARFQHCQRPYGAAEVARLQGSEGPLSEYPGSAPSKRLYKILQEKYAAKSCSHTFGVLDPVQIIQLAEAGLETVYVSGWQCSSTASTSNEPGPDLADYPMDTVPNKVEQLYKAQRFHNRKMHEYRMRQTKQWREENPKKTDYCLPIIADADTGHGGLTAVMKLTRMFIENGAAGRNLIYAVYLEL